MNGDLYPQLLLTGRLLTVALSASYVAFILGRFQSTGRSRKVVIFWVGYWVAVAAQYVISVVSTMTGIRDTYGSLLGRAIADISQSACLLLVAAALFARRRRARSHAKAPSAVLMAVTIALSLVVVGISIDDPASDASVLSAAVLATAALCSLATSWVVFTARTARACAAVFLLIYAADYYSPFGLPAEGSVGSAVHAAVLLLVFIVLGYMCAFVLREEAVRSAPNANRRQPAARPAIQPAEPIVAEPENVTLTFQNGYALLYLWGKKSGRVALAAMAGIAVTVIVAIIAALPKLLPYFDAVK